MHLLIDLSTYSLTKVTLMPNICKMTILQIMHQACAKLINEGLFTLLIRLSSMVFTVIIMHIMTLQMNGMVRLHNAVLGITLITAACVG